MSTADGDNGGDAPPSAPRGDGGKDARGRFAKGNRLGRGNPLAGRAMRIRAILLKALKPADAKAIADTLITLAKAGDLAAIKELLDRTIGKPAQQELMERIEALEERIGTKGRHR